MTLDNVLHELIQCLGNEGDTIVSWEQVRYWPKGAIATLEKAGWIVPTMAVESAECPACEESCLMPVRVIPAQKGKPARAFVICKMGRVEIPLECLQQWQLTQRQIVRWIFGALGFKGNLEKVTTNGIFTLGTLQGKIRLGVIKFDATSSICLKISGHSLPLQEAVYIENGQPVIDRAAILAIVDMPPSSAQNIKRTANKRDRETENTYQKTDLEIGTPEWRKENARKAANARHDQPGGNREKHKKIRAIWATGKYSSRDRCAEGECAALGMSYASARKALINTPDPPRHS